MMVCSRSAQLENVALLAIHITTKEDFGKLLELLVVTTRKLVLVLPIQLLVDEREKGLHIILVGPWDQGRSEFVKFQGIPGCRILKEGEEFHVRAFRIPKELMVGCLDKKLHCVMSTGHPAGQWCQQSWEHLSTNSLMGI